MVGVADEDAADEDAADEDEANEDEEVGLWNRMILFHVLPVEDK